MEVYHSKNRVMHIFSLRLWSGYLLQFKNIPLLPYHLISTLDASADNNVPIASNCTHFRARDGEII